MTMPPGSRPRWSCAGRPFPCLATAFYAGGNSGRSLCSSGLSTTKRWPCWAVLLAICWITSMPVTNTQSGSSRAGWLLTVRARLLATSYVPGAARRDAFDRRLPPTWLWNEDVDDWMRDAQTQRVTFLARRHLVEPVGLHGLGAPLCALGTPLYVALADPAT